MIRLRNVYETKQAYLYLYRLLEQRLPGESISHTEMPSMVAHKQFVLAKPYRMWAIIETMETPEWVGAVLLTQNNEIGISIDTEHRRKGYARAAIERVRRDYQPLPADASKRPGCFVANVAPTNPASIALFTGLGAVHIQNSYRL